MDSPLYRHSREVAFGETDASGWVYFPNFFSYVEEAEHAFLRSCGLFLFQREKGGWPRVHVSCDYKRPLVTGDQIEVQLKISHIGSSSLTWDFEIVSASDGGSIAVGSMTTVRVNHLGKSQEISEEERAALEK